MACLYRTSTNCAPKTKGKKTPAAAAGGPGGRAVDTGEGVIVKQERGDDSDKENEEGNMAPERELGDTPKPKPRVSKRQKQNDEFQKQVINLLDQEDNDIDLCFQSLAKKLKRTLTEGEIDIVMDKINGVVSRHVRQARIKKEGGVDLCCLAHQVNLSINRSRQLSNWVNILSKMSLCLYPQCHHCSNILMITT